MLKSPLHPSEIVTAMNVAGDVTENILSFRVSGERGTQARKPEQVALILDLIIEAAARHEQSWMLRHRPEENQPTVMVHVLKFGGDLK